METCIRFDHPLHFSKTFSDRIFIIPVLIFAVLSYVLVLQAWPSLTGVDMSSYLEHYFQTTLEASPFRPVGASMMIGWISEFNYPGAATWMLFFYLILILSVYYVARLFGVMAARVATLLLVCHVQLTAFSKDIGSDVLMGVALALWCVLIVRFYRHDKLSIDAMQGFASFFPLLIRPSALILIVFALHPLVRFGISRRTVLRAIVFALAFLAGANGYALFNHVKYGEYYYVKDAGVQWLSYNMFLYTHMLARENGPRSQKLFDLVEQEILTHPIYQEKKITIDDFFHSNRDIRKMDDLQYLNDRYDKGILLDAALEAFKENPVHVTIHVILLPIYKLFNRPIDLSLPIQERVPPQAKMMSTSVNSLSNHVHVEVSPEHLAKQREIDKTISKLTKEGNYNLCVIYRYFIFDIFPPIGFFLVLSLLLLGQVRQDEVRILLLMELLCFVIVAASAQFTPMTRLRLPYDFIFILAGVIGLLGNHSLTRWMTHAPMGIHARDARID